MPNHARIRPIVPSDIPTVREVVDATLFPAEMLDEMIAPYLGGDGCSDIWLAYEQDGQPVAIAYCEAERMTDGTWNLLAIGVHPGLQGRGIGTELIRHLETTLADRGERVLLVETSGLPDYEETRRFYQHLGFAEEARIREFYAAGEDKIVFWKSLAAT